MSTVQQAARKIEMTSAEKFWYILGCIAFGAAYLQKVPVKKALSDYGLIEMTSAEKTWYVLGCIAFGAAYFMKIPVAKALSELEQYHVARTAPRNELAPQDQAESHEQLEVPEQHEAHRALAGKGSAKP